MLGVSDLGIKGSYPNNPKIRKVSRARNLSASWLPSLEEDHRHGKGRVGKTGKGDPHRGSIGIPEPYEAARRVAVWVQELQRSARVFKEQQEAEHQHALETYWERWYARAGSKPKTRRNFRPMAQGHPSEVGWRVLWGQAPTLGTEVGGENHRC